MQGMEPHGYLKVVLPRSRLWLVAAAECNCTNDSRCWITNHTLLTCPQSHTGQTSDDIDTLHKVASRTFDLCNSSRMTVDTLFLTNHLSLAWSPPDASLAGTMVTKRLVITAVGRGMYRLIF